MERDIMEFHKSISEELKSSQDRIRNLIGGTNWQNDGEHKESLLRKTLRLHLPESLRIGKGFVCHPQGNTSQIDVLVMRNDMPVLYKDGELNIVTPEAVKAIIEVKTTQEIGDLRKALVKLAENAEVIRRYSRGHPVWAGLFVFNESNIDHKAVLREIQNVSKNAISTYCRLIDCISIGRNDFFRFWEDGASVHSVDGPVWHSYDLRNLSMAYFISNIVCDLSPEMSPVTELSFWFPVKGTKEVHRKYYLEFAGNEVKTFEIGSSDI